MFLKQSLDFTSQLSFLLCWRFTFTVFENAQCFWIHSSRTTNLMSTEPGLLGCSIDANRCVLETVPTISVWQCSLHRLYEILPATNIARAWKVIGFCLSGLAPFSHSLRMNWFDTVRSTENLKFKCVRCKVRRKSINFQLNWWTYDGKCKNHQEIHQHRFHLVTSRLV